MSAQHTPGPITLGGRPFELGKVLRVPHEKRLRGWYNVVIVHYTDNLQPFSETWPLGRLNAALRKENGAAAALTKAVAR